MDLGSRDTVLGIGTKIGTFTLIKLQGTKIKDIGIRKQKIQEQGTYIWLNIKT